MRTCARAHARTPAVFHAEHLNHRQENYSRDCTVISNTFCALTLRALVNLPDATPTTLLL